MTSPNDESLISRALRAVTGTTAAKRGGDKLFLDAATLRRVVRLAQDPRAGGWRRVAYFDALMPLFQLFFQSTRVAQGLDELLYPDFRDQPVQEPIFIVANPRSGTTFLHRLMSLDEEQFTYLKLWQTLLPSITLNRGVQRTAEADARAGGLLRRAMDKVDQLAFGGWDGIHRTGFSRAEEDEGFFVMTLLSPGIFLLFPEIDRLRYVGFQDDLPADERERLMRYYKRCLQQHVYAEGGKRTFLGKSVMLPGRLRGTLDVFPDARFIYLVRHPYQAIPSFLSMFYVAWQAHRPDIPKDGAAVRQLAEVALEYYRRMHRYRDELDEERYIVLRYEDLVADPYATVSRVYDAFDLTMSDEYDAKLREATEQARRYKSSHSYSLEEYGLTPSMIQDALPEVFEAYGFEP